VLQLNNITLILLLFITSIAAVSFAFADNPTPYNKWDFDISKVDVSQIQHDLEKLDISIDVLYKGQMHKGTANVYANVTDPDGYSRSLFGQVQDLSIAEIQTVNLRGHLPKDGKYEISVMLTPPAKPHLDHIFDSEKFTFDVDANGREKSVDVVGVNSEWTISYSLQNYRDVKYNEMIHAVIALPENHMFEKIAIVNGSSQENIPHTQKTST